MQDRKAPCRLLNLPKDMEMSTPVCPVNETRIRDSLRTINEMLKSYHWKIRNSIGSPSYNDYNAGTNHNTLGGFNRDIIAALGDLSTDIRTHIEYRKDYLYNVFTEPRMKAHSNLLPWPLRFFSRENKARFEILHIQMYLDKCLDLINGDEALGSQGIRKPLDLLRNLVSEVSMDNEDKDVIDMDLLDKVQHMVTALPHSSTAYEQFPYTEQPVEFTEYLEWHAELEELQRGLDETWELINELDSYWREKVAGGHALAVSKADEDDR